MPNAAVRYRTIAMLGLPIIGGMLSQSLLNLVDAALVGQLGPQALAATGAGSYGSFVAISLILGLSSAVQSMVARRRGQRRYDEMLQPVVGGLLLSVLIALPLSLLFIHFSQPLLAPLTQPDSAGLARQYFDYRTMAMVAVAMNLAFRGWWNGTERPGYYLISLIATHLLNIAVSYGLIFGAFGLPTMGAPGAGLGTAVALFAGAGINSLMLWQDSRRQQITLFSLKPALLRRLISLSIPPSLQQLLMALAVISLFYIVGMLGMEQQAIAHVLINLTLFLILPAVGFGVAAMSLVSRALGEHNVELAHNWGWAVAKTALGALCLISLPMWLLTDQVLGLFLSEAALIAQAHTPLQLAALAICVDAVAIVLGQALLGAGASRLVLTISTLMQWGLFLPLAWLAGPVLGYGLLGIWLCQVLYRGLSSLIYIRIWQRQQWQTCVL